MHAYNNNNNNMWIITNKKKKKNNLFVYFLYRSGPSHIFHTKRIIPIYVFGKCSYATLKKITYRSLQYLGNPPAFDRCKTTRTMLFDHVYKLYTL